MKFTEKFNEQVLTVKEYNDYINEVVSLAPVIVEGEVSNYREIKGRNFCYFDIKDDLSVAKCFQGFWRSQPISLQNGVQVRVLGFPNLQKNGSFVIDVREITLIGEGDLMKNYLELKEKLQTEGLFDLDHKKPLPSFPLKVGLIAGKNSSAYHDVIAELKERWGGLTVNFFPVKVQGMHSKKEVTDAIHFFNQNLPVDVLIIARGGGSMEELWSFNTEEVVRAVFASKIPVISAIGHEDHWTLVDYVADMRAKTPTKAAQLAVPDQGEISQRLEYYRDRLEKLLVYKMDLIKRSFEQLELRLKQLYQKDREDYLGKILMLEGKASFLMKGFLSRSLFDLSSLELRLKNANPVNVIEKGAAWVEFKGKRILKVEDADLGAEIKVVLQNGFFLANIKSKESFKKNYGKRS